LKKLRRSEGVRIMAEVKKVTKSTGNKFMAVYDAVDGDDPVKVFSTREKLLKWLDSGDSNEINMDTLRIFEVVAEYDWSSKWSITKDSDIETDDYELEDDD
jgi:hypothetical protein